MYGYLNKNPRARVTKSHDPLSKVRSQGLGLPFHCSMDRGMYECVHVCVHLCIYIYVSMCVYIGVLHAHVGCRLSCLNPAEVPAGRVPEWASAGEAQHRPVASWFEGVRRSRHSMSGTSLRD